LFPIPTRLRAQIKPHARAYLGAYKIIIIFNAWIIMKSLAICKPLSFLIIVIIFSDTPAQGVLFKILRDLIYHIVCIKFIICCYTVTAQKGPGRHIVHPGQDVELLCTFNDLVVSNHTLEARWEIGHMGPYGINALLNGQVTGYSANGSSIIVENIMMNGTEYRCVLFNDTGTRLNESDPIILYVAGE